MNMDAQEWNELLSGVVADLKANLPKVTGNMTRNTRAYATWGQEVIGHIEISVPYARFVNYGFERYPNSKKLSRDYNIVERTIKNSINARMEGATWM